MAEKLPTKRVINVHGQRVVTNHPLLWTVYSVETGEAFERSPIDARELVRSGEFSFTPPGRDAEAAPPAPLGDAATAEPETPAPDVSERADETVRAQRAAEKEQQLAPRGRRQRGA